MEPVTVEAKPLAVIQQRAGGVVPVAVYFAGVLMLAVGIIGPLLALVLDIHTATIAWSLDHVYILLPAGIGTLFTAGLIEACAKGEVGLYLRWVFTAGVQTLLFITLMLSSVI
jgi:hypothetical protein